MQLEDIREGADVISSDGHRVGKLSRVVVKEESLEVTHLCVDPGLVHRGESIWAGGWGNPHERVIPAGVLEDERDGAVHITMTAEQFRDMSVKYDTVYWKPMPRPSSLAEAAINTATYIGANFPGGAGAGPYVPFDKVEKAADEVDIKQGSAVWRLRPHEKIGEVERVLLNEETLKIQALVFRRRHLLEHRDVVLPVRYVVEVVEVLEGVVRVAISDSELRSLAPYEPRDAAGRPA